MPRRLAAFLTLALVALSLSAGARASSLCVLYFDNNTGDTSWDPLKKGLADMVVSDLSAVDGLTVVERSRLEEVIGELKLQRTSHFDQATAKKIGKLVGATYAVTGAISAVAPKIRLDVRLIEVQTGKVVAADKIVGAPDRFFELQAELLALFTRSLGKALPSAQSVARLDRLDTALLYGRGLDFADQGDPEAASKALQDVVKKAPKFALGQRRYLEIMTRLQEAKARRSTQLASGEAALLKKIDAELKGGLPSDRSSRTLTRYFGYRVLRGNVMLGLAAKLGPADVFKRTTITPANHAEAKRHMLAYVDNQVALAKELAAVGRKGIPHFPKVDDADLKAAQELDLGSTPASHAFMSFQTIARSTAGFIIQGQPELFASLRVKLSPTLAELDPTQVQRALDLMDQALVDIEKNERADLREREMTRALTLYGDLLLELGRPAEAIARWQQILDDYPKSPEFEATEKRIRAALAGAR